MPRKLDIIKKIDAIQKDIDKVVPPQQESVAPIIKVGGYKGRKYEFKFRPRNVLDYARDCMKYRFLSDPQKDTLVHIFGLDPEVWDTTYSEFIFLVGQGGGKNTVIEVATSYVLNYLINPVDIYKVFSDLCNKEIPRNQDFEITNNSMVGEKQAKTVFFDRIKSVLKNTIEPESGENLFEKYMHLDLRDQGTGDIKSKVIEFPSFFPNSGMIKLHSLDSGVSTFEGKFILLALADEPSRANSLTTYSNAKLLYEGLSGNVSTRFPKGVGKLLAFSYPNTTEYDLTYELAEEEMKKIEEAKELGIPYKSFRKVFIYSTFQYNPSVSKTDAKIADAYRKNPAKAKTRYECIKSKSEHAFFNPYIHKITECVMKGMQNRVTAEQDIKVKKFKDGTDKKYTVLEIFEIKGDTRARCWACDTSINKDRFVLASGFLETPERSLEKVLNEDPITGRIEGLPIVDTILVWSPNKKYPVDYDNVHQIIDRLLNAFPNSIYYKSDRYQTESIMSIFESRGIRGATTGYSNKEQFRLYSALRLAVFNNQVGYINHPLMIEELERLQKVGKLEKVDHPLNFSKDVADVVAQLYELLTSVEFAQSSEVAGLDKFKDSKLIDLVDQLIRHENEARSRGITHIDAYICEVMSVTPEDCRRIRDMKQIYFPN